MVNWALQFDGVQNTVDLNTLNHYGSGLGAGFYASFYIQTTGTTQDGIGYANVDERVTIGLNQNHVQSVVSGCINLYFSDSTGANIVAGNTASNGFNDGAVHFVEVQVASNNLSIHVDGNNTSITYNVHGTPASWNDFGFDGFGVMTGHSIAATIDKLWLGYTPTNIYAKYEFNEGQGVNTVDSLGNSTPGILQGSPTPTWVTGIAPQIYPNKTINIRPRAFAPGIAR